MVSQENRLVEVKEKAERKLHEMLKPVYQDAEF